MKKIKISKGFVLLVNNVDFKEVSKYKWSYCKGHARHNRLGFVHRFIAQKMFGNKLKNFQIDHKNRNGLDNRRPNLRLATHSQNLANQKRKKGISKYRGVRWDKQRNKWRADIQVNGKKISIGRSLSKIKCAKLYDKKAKEFYGKFAYLNFP